jgi:transcriptional regulator GlxA family with amidase domain
LPLACCPRPFLRNKSYTDEVDAGVFAVRAPWGLDALAEADTIFLPGLADPTAPIHEHVLRALRAAAESGTRIASICVGAFTLAASGLLNGLRATTQHSVERIAIRVGFGSPTTFRDRFKRLVGTSPHAYRRAFGGSPPR